MKGVASLEDLMQAALAAPVHRRAEALRVLRGEPVLAAGVPSASDPEHYLTLKELAERLGFSAFTLWRWQVPGHDLGGRRRFRLSEVAAYLDSDQFKRRAAALRAQRKPSVHGTPTSTRAKISKP